MATLTEFQNDAEHLRVDALAAFERATTPDELEAARVRYLGDRSGQLREVQQALGALPKEHKPPAGKVFNALKIELGEALERRLRRSGRCSGFRRRFAFSRPVTTFVATSSMRRTPRYSGRSKDSAWTRGSASSI